MMKKVQSRRSGKSTRFEQLREKLGCPFNVLQNAARSIRQRTPFKQFIDTVQNFNANGGFVYAGHMAFMAFVSIFPFLIFLVALAGFLGNEAVANQFTQIMFDYLPDHVVQTLEPVVRQILTQRRGGLLTLGVIGTLWSASSGLNTLRLALNVGAKDRAPWLIWRLQSLLYIIVAGVSVFVLMLLILSGPVVWRLLEAYLPLPAGFEIAWWLVRYGVVFACLTFVIMNLHFVLIRARLKYLNLLPGAMITSALWLMLAGGITVYIDHMGNYTATYGSLSGVVITLLFFYFSSALLIFGGELSRRIALKK